MREPPGLLAAGGDLSPTRLLAAYERGVFPWYSAQQPILWWSPDPRMVLFPAEFNCSRSLSKTLRHGPFTTRVDLAFAAIHYRNFPVVVLNLNAPSALLGFQLGGIVGHKFLSKYRVGIDLERSVLRLKNVS